MKKTKPIHSFNNTSNTDRTFDFGTMLKARRLCFCYFLSLYFLRISELYSDDNKPLWLNEFVPLNGPIPNKRSKLYGYSIADKYKVFDTEEEQLELLNSSVVLRNIKHVHKPFNLIPDDYGNLL